MKVQMLAELVHEKEKQKNVVHELDFAQELGRSKQQANFKGYEGALVPGVTLLAWTIPLVLDRYSDIWLRKGYFDISFRKPVYAEDPIEICLGMLSFLTTTGEDGKLEMTALNRPGALISGRVGLEGGEELLEKVIPFPELPNSALEPTQPDLRPLLSTSVCQPGQLFRPLLTFLSPERASHYAHLFARDPSQRWAGQAHPGWLAGQMNKLLESNFSHYPAILARMRFKLLAPVHTGQTLVFTGRAEAMMERKGRNWLVLRSTLYSRESREVLAQLEYTVIYRIQSRAKL